MQTFSWIMHLKSHRRIIDAALEEQLQLQRERAAQAHFVCTLDTNLGIHCKNRREKSASLQINVIVVIKLGAGFYNHEFTSAFGFFTDFLARTLFFFRLFVCLFIFLRCVVVRALLRVANAQWDSWWVAYSIVHGSAQFCFRKVGGQEFV